MVIIGLIVCICLLILQVVCNTSKIIQLEDLVRKQQPVVLDLFKIQHEQYLNVENRVDKLYKYCSFKDNND